MKWKLLPVLLFTAVAFLAVVSTSYAASNSVSVNAVSAPRITMSLDTDTVGFADVDLDVGSTVANALAIQVKSNKLWDYSVAAGSNLIGVTTGASVPIANLQWADSGTGVWNPFTIASDTIGTGLDRGVNNYDYDYKIGIGYDYPPDTYSVTITYTAVQQP